MEKKNIDWSNIGFGYMPTDYRYVSMYQNGSWDEGVLTSDPNITLNECACVLQYAQTCFEGLKAYTTEDGHIVTFRPDLNGERMENSAKGLEMPPFPKERFVDAITKVVEANAAFVPPYGSGATLYIPFAELVDIAQEIERLKKEQKRLEGELARSRGMLSNERFLSKAPEAKIAEEKEKLAKYEQMMEQVTKRLEQLA